MKDPLKTYLQQKVQGSSTCLASASPEFKLRTAKKKKEIKEKQKQKNQIIDKILGA
jgi:hypothetical protein